jgi:hypothetical protein
MYHCVTASVNIRDIFMPKAPQQRVQAFLYKENSKIILFWWCRA